MHLYIYLEINDTDRREVKGNSHHMNCRIGMKTRPSRRQRAMEYPGLSPCIFATTHFLQTTKHLPLLVTTQ